MEKASSEQQARCYWVTGLSGAGKTTLSSMLTDHLRANGVPVVLLDGDELRKVLSSAAYTREDRVDLAMRYSRLCKLIVDQGVNVVIGVIGLYRELHTWNRDNIKGYVEVFIDTPMDELKRRDPKGIYSKADAGEISNVSGVDLIVDFPDDSHVHLRWAPGKCVDTMFDEMIQKISEHGNDERNT